MEEVAGMTTSAVEAVRGATAVDVKIDDVALRLDLIDGRTLSVPIVWFPRLSYATADERAHFELLGDGESIHWPDLDEDIEVAHLLLGWGSGEGSQSLQRWLDARAAASDR